MLTVRFPGGTAIQYNKANYLSYRDNHMSLYTAKGGKWVASILNSSGAIVEVQAPCRIYDARQATEQLRDLLGRMRELTSYNDSRVLADMKRELENFDARKMCWKG